MTELVLSVNLSRSGPPAGTATIENRGPEAIRLWRTSNTWGASALRFEITRGESTIQVTRRLQDFTRNVPSSLEVPAGGRHELLFDLGDGGWDGGERLARLGGRGRRLVAIFEVPETPEAHVHGVWTGRVGSRPAALEAS